MRSKGATMCVNHVCVLDFDQLSSIAIINPIHKCMVRDFFHLQPTMVQLHSIPTTRIGLIRRMIISAWQIWLRDK